MKIYPVLKVGLYISIILFLIFASGRAAFAGLAQVGGLPQPAAADSGPGAVSAGGLPAGAASDNPDSNPTRPGEVVIPEEYQVRSAAADGQAAPAVAAVPSSIIYFTPQDENTTTTVLFFYNLNPITSTVGLRTFFTTGSLSTVASFNIPPKGLVRVSADTVNTISASWSKYILINFTTFSAYAEATLPQGVHLDGYVALDPKGFVDPLTITSTIPLHFSAEPAMIFVPSLVK